MDKFSKKPDVKVVAASDSSLMKPDKKGKRSAEAALEKCASVKKQLKVSFLPPPKKKVEMSNFEDDSASESDEEETDAKLTLLLKKLPATGAKNGSLVYTKKQEPSDGTSDLDSSSDEEMDIFVTTKKSTAVSPQENPVSSHSSSGSDSESSPDEEMAIVTMKKPTAAVSKKKLVSSDSSSGSDSDSSSDEGMEPIAAAPRKKLMSNDNSSGSDSDGSSDKEMVIAATIKKPIAAAPQKKPVSSGSSSESGSDSSLDERIHTAVTKRKPTTDAPQKKPMSSDSSYGSDSDSSSEEDNKSAVAKMKLPAVVSKRKPESSDDSSDSDSSSEEDIKTVFHNKKSFTILSKEKPEPISTSSESDSDKEDVRPVIFRNKKKPALVALLKRPELSDSSSDSDSDEDDKRTALPKKKSTVSMSKKKADSGGTSSESASEEELKVNIPKKPAVSQKGKAAATSKMDSDSNDDSSESSEEGQDAEVKMKDVPSANGNDKQTDTKSDKPITSACQTQSSGPKTLFLGNLSFQVGQDDVADFFKEAKVVNVRLEAADDGSFRGSGHVEFATEAAAKKALEINGQMFLGRPEKPEFAREWGSTPQRGKEYTSYQKAGQGQSQTIYVKGFDKSLDEYQVKSSLEKHFQSCGEISRLSIPKDCVTGASKGIAFMDFKDQNGASKAIELNGSDLGGCTLSVDKAWPRGDCHDGGRNNSSTKRGGHGQSLTIYVKGFDKSLDEYQVRSSLEEHFQTCGEITRVSIPKDNETGALRGIAFLDLKDQDSVSRALEFSGSDLGGYTLTVNIARTRSDGHDGSWSGGKSDRRGRDGGGGGWGCGTPSW